MGIFDSVKVGNIQSSMFDMSHDVKLSFQMGKLVPTCVVDCLPGDKWKINCENMLRFMPLVSPVMHRIKVVTDYYFVPTRLLWKEFPDWVYNNIQAEAPYIVLGGGSPSFTPEVGSLADYMGLPTLQSSGAPFIPEQMHISPMAFAAYDLIYDEYYRDQNLQTAETFVPLVPGNNSSYINKYIKNDESVRRRAWMHDYFTSCLPFAQKGSSVLLPLTVDQELQVYTPTGLAAIDTEPGIIRIAGSATTLDSETLNTDADGFLRGGGSTYGYYDPNGTLLVDVQANATDINTVRTAFMMQEWLERNARGGTRYVEANWSHFHTKSSDARLQRPEFIGRFRQNMVISEVLSTAQTDSDAGPTPVGNMAGHGISVGGGDTYHYFCEEHGFIIGLINVQPETAYQQGVHKMWSRLDRFDYPFPSFANLGEQPVKNKEVYAYHDEPEGEFGYLPTYSDMKYVVNRVAGELRDTLSFWQEGRIFDTAPALNSEFIQCTPSNRIFAVTAEDEDHIVGHIFNNLTAIRKLPKYGIPAGLK